MGKGGYSDYTPSSGTNYNNGSLTASQIKEMQDYYGVTADGMWGKNSTAAAGGLSAADAWTKYQGAIGQGGYDDYYGSGGTDYSGLMLLAALIPAHMWDLTQEKPEQSWWKSWGGAGIP